MHRISDVLDRKGRHVYRVDSEDSVLTAVEQMARHQTGSLVVQEGAEIVGIFTERDLAMRVVLPQRDTRATLVGEVMTPQVFCVQPEMRLSDAMALMTQQRVRHLPVVEAGAVCGVVSIGDLVKCVASDQEMELRYLAAYIRGEYAV
ncbi:MAG: CBS domain-containing protein [Candidatus Eisenbacteria bacterium]|jgi:CBS domain-containing protein|nr:CBS domain-containing protein [Candidatus Eisenbacteria bacterium]